MLVEIKPLTESIEERVLNYLGLEIIDLETLTELSIPEGYVRYQVYRNARHLCSISIWGERYHTRAIHNPAGYRSLYEAATCWVDCNRLAQIENQIQTVAKLEQLLAPKLPDYM